MFWTNTKKKLKEQYMTQVELANRIGISLRTVQNWIGNDIIPNGELTYKIAQELETTVEELITGESKLSFLSDEEKKLIEDYRETTDEFRTTIRTLASQVPKKFS